MLLAKYFQTGIASGPRLEIRRTVTHETVLQADDIAMIDRLQDVDLALEILEQLGGEFLSADRFDSDKLVRLLLVYMMGAIQECQAESVSRRVGAKERRLSQRMNHFGMRMGDAHGSIRSVHRSEAPPPNFLADMIIP